MRDLAAKLRSTAAGLRTKLTLKKHFEDAANAIEAQVADIEEKDKAIQSLNRKIKKLEKENK